MPQWDIKIADPWDDWTSLNCPSTGYLVAEVDSFSTFDMEVNSLLLDTPDIGTLIIHLLKCYIHVCIAFYLKTERIGFTASRGSCCYNLSQYFFSMLKNITITKWLLKFLLGTRQKLPVEKLSPDVIGNTGLRFRAAFYRSAPSIDSKWFLLLLAFWTLVGCRTNMKFLFTDPLPDNRNVLFDQWRKECNL